VTATEVKLLMRTAQALLKKRRTKFEKEGQKEDKKKQQN